MRNPFTSISIILVSVIVGFVALFNLSEVTPIHWIRGEENIFISSNIGIFAIPVLMLLSYLSIRLLSKRRGNNEKVISHASNIGLFALFILQLFIISQGFGIQFESNFFIGVLVGIVTILLASPIPKTKPNVIYGLRTPWTLKDERVWRQSNRFAGKLLFVAGLLILSLSFVIPEFITNIMIYILLVVVIIAVVASYVIYRQLHTGEEV